MDGRPPNGQVENQVGAIRERLFCPRVRVRSMEELNDWLLDQCVARAKVQAHPEIVGKTIREVFELIPCVTGKPRIAELVAFQTTDITAKGFWRGRARLHLVPHVNAPVADLPVRRVIEGQHIIADLSPPYGRVVHDYLA